MTTPLTGCDVVFVLPHLGPGGAQRVVTLVANEWSKQGLAIGLVTTLDDKPDAHQLSPEVRRVRLRALAKPATSNKGAGRTLDSFAKRVLAKIRVVMRNAEAALDTEPMCRNHVHASHSVRYTLCKLRHLGNRSLPFMLVTLKMAILKILSLTAGLISRAMLFATPKSNSAAKGNLNDGRSRIPTGIALARLLLITQPERRLRRLFAADPPPRIISLLTRTNINTAIATWGLPVHLVISERNDPDLQHLKPLWERLRIVSYLRADVVTSNSSGILRKMGKYRDEAHCQLLPNPLILASVDVARLTPKPIFIVVARLVHQKAIDILLEAFALIESHLPAWQIEILGAGPLQEELQAQAQELGINDRVNFRGHVATPMAHLESASVFVLPSRFEGMPNSLLEAMALGVTPIVSDASPGPLEIVSHQENGLVVPVEDIQELSGAMHRLAVDEELRNRLGQAAQQFVARHKWETVEPIWRQAMKLPTSGRLSQQNDT